MRCSTSLLSAALLAAAVSAAAAAPPPGTGVASGRSDCVYALEGPSSAPAPPAVTCGGFTQAVRRSPGGWEVTVASAPRPVPTAAPLPRPRWDGPGPSEIPQAFRTDLAAALAGATDADDACARLGAFLSERLASSEDPDAPADPAAVCRAGRASCVGRARLARLALEALGLSARPVVGLRAPADGTPHALEGGALHVWLEVRAPGAPPAYFDPAFSVGWVPARYLVLREGGGEGAGELSRWRGGTLTTLWRRDRTYFEPGPRGVTRLWRAVPAQPRGASVLGKFLDGSDAPLSGTAYLRGPSGTLAAPLWEGNFWFQDLPEGDYELALTGGGAPVYEAFSLLPLDKRTRVFYSRDGRGRAADHGTGRQPGGSLSP